MGGATDFSYFDDGVQGQLQGSVTGQAQAVDVRLTLGVDANPTTACYAFYVATSSEVSIQGIQAQGTASGQLTIGSLAGVAVNGSVRGLQRERDDEPCGRPARRPQAANL